MPRLCRHGGRSDSRRGAEGGEVRFHNRRRLEELFADAGGLGCRDRRGRLVRITSRLPPDGSRAASAGGPKPGAGCRGIPEQSMAIVGPSVDCREG